MTTDGLDLTDRQLCEAFTFGYQLARSDGIAEGRRDLAAELMPVGDAIRTLPRGDTQSELERRRRTYRTPALTAEQIHAQAAASWAELD